MHTDLTQEELMNPKASLKSAYLHALFTGQMEFCELVEAQQAQLSVVCHQLIDEGLLPATPELQREGFGSLSYQRIFESNRGKDTRFDEVLKYLSVREMVEVQNATSQNMFH